jgi:hypothetical protein
MKTWISYIDGLWFFWTPSVGIDPSLGDEAMLLGATAYGRCKYQGRPENECHIEAEKVAYIYQYNVKY